MSKRIARLATAAALSVLATGALAQNSGGAGIGAAPGTSLGAAPTTNATPPGSNMLSPGANEFGTANGNIGALPGGTFDLNTPERLGTGSSTTGSGSSLPSNDTPTTGSPPTNFGTGGMQPLPGTPAGTVPGNLGIGLPPAPTPGSQ